MNEAYEWCFKYRHSRKEAELHQAWDLYYHVFKRINKQLPSLTVLEVQYVAPALVRAQVSCVCEGLLRLAMHGGLFLLSSHYDFPRWVYQQLPRLVVSGMRYAGDVLYSVCMLRQLKAENDLHHHMTKIIMSSAIAW